MHCDAVGLWRARVRGLRAGLSGVPRLMSPSPQVATSKRAYETAASICRSTYGVAPRLKIVLEDNKTKVPFSYITVREAGVEREDTEKRTRRGVFRTRTWGPQQGRRL